MRRFVLLLAAILPFGTLAPGCSSSHTSQAGQLITCNTDPMTGTILRCVPGGGSGSGGTGTCQDIDEDGDGEPHDDGDDSQTSSSSSADDDDDGDGIKNEDDCDEHEGEDGDDHDSPGQADLPYDVAPQLGSTATPIVDAFAEKGPQPAAIVSVTMDGGTWRLTELQNSTPFVVTQDDCTHAGNRDVGRDRVFVTWKNTDGSTMMDHLDIRYCNAN